MEIKESTVSMETEIKTTEGLVVTCTQVFNTFEHLDPSGLGDVTGYVQDRTGVVIHTFEDRDQTRLSEKEILDKYVVGQLETVK